MAKDPKTDAEPAAAGVVGAVAPSNEPHAESNETRDGIKLRPPPSTPISQLGHVVIGNFTGTHEGEGWHVAHGTPARDLPKHIRDAVLKSNPNAIGLYPPPAPKPVG